MNRLFSLLLILLMGITAGCITVNVPGDSGGGGNGNGQPPVAYIDSIQPSSASQGQPVTFTGHGTDTNGSVVGYEWRSNIDGILSTSSSFTTSALSIGSHSITLRVLDNDQNWSTAASAGITITEAIDRPVILSFNASPAIIVRGGSSQLRWNATNAQRVVVDNGIGEVPSSGSITIYPSVSTVFTLTASNQNGSVTSSASITVRESAAVGNPVIGFTAQHLGGNSWQLNWNVQYATDIVIEPDIGPVEPSGSTVVTVPSGQTVTYRLTATNDWGWAYWQVILSQP